MAVKKIQMIPPGYTDVVHPETDTDMVLMPDGKTLTTYLADYEYKTATVVSRQIRLTKQSNTNILKFKLDTPIPSGTGITISLDGGVTSKPLKDFASNAITELEAGYVEVINDAVNFTLRPRGAVGLPPMLDWSAYDTIYDLSGTMVITGSNRTIIDVSGEGYLMFVRSFTENEELPKVTIYIDGISYIFDKYQSNVVDYNGNLILQPIYFKSSLKIIVSHSSGISKLVGADYLYLLKKTKPDNKKQTLLLSSQRKSSYGQTSSTTLTDVVNVTGSGYLLGVVFSGKQTGTTSGLNTYGDITIDGVKKMNDRNLIGFTNYSYNTHFFTGPIRFNNGFVVKHRTNNQYEPLSIARVFYTLD